MKLSRALITFVLALALALPLTGCVPTSLGIDVGPVGQNRPLVVKVTVRGDTPPSQPFTQPVTVSSGNATCTATLDTNGSGSCTLPAFTVAEKYTINASWPGEGVHIAANASTTVQVMGAYRDPELYINRSVSNVSRSPGDMVELQVDLWSEGFTKYPSSAPVTIEVQGIQVCTMQLGVSPFNGVCKFNAPLASGNFTVTARFPGDNLYLPATAKYTLAVNPWYLDWDFTYNGQAYPGRDPLVTGTFEINKPYTVGVRLAAPTLAGQVQRVTFEVVDGKGTGCTINSATATCTITFTSPGKKVVKATLLPTTNLYRGGVVRASFEIPLYATTLAITTSPRATLTRGTTTVRVTVTGEGPVPTGVVTVSGASGCTITLVNGSGTCQLSFNAAKNHTLIATYPGDALHSSSTAQTTHTVELPAPTPIPPTPCTGEGC